MPGLTRKQVRSISPEDREDLKQSLLEKTFQNIEKTGEKHGLEGIPMDKDVIERTGEGPNLTKAAQHYSVGYVRGRETRGHGRRKNIKKKTKKHARVKLVRRNYK